MKRLNRRVAIAGATGAIGAYLINYLNERDVPVVALMRDKDETVNGAIETCIWDGRTLGEWATALDGALAVVNLAGFSLNVLWTPENRNKIVTSRVESARVIANAIQQAKTPPRVWVNASAVGYYGDTGSETVDESSPAGKGFLADTCKAWEAAAEGAVKLRFGVVLMKDEGFLKALDGLVKKGLGGAAGSGQQWVSWIHIDDLCAMIWHVIEHEETGAFNAVSPYATQNEDLMFALRHAYGMPWSPPVPSLAVKLGARLMATEAELILMSSRVTPARFEGVGFRFQYPRLEMALANLL